MTTTTTTQAAEQIRLPGQTAAHEGPVDMTMMYVAHHAFRRDLDLFAPAALATPVDDRAAWGAMVERFDAFATVLHRHHSGEDAGLWPLLLQRVDAARDAVGRQTLEAMEAEHAAFDPLLQMLGENLRTMAAGGSEDDRAMLAVVAAETRDALGRHLEHEETEAIRLIQRHLTQADWDRMEQEHFTSHRPDARELVFLVPWLCSGLPEDARRRAFAHTGQVMAVIWRLTRRRFDRHHRTAFAHV